MFDSIAISLDMLVFTVIRVAVALLCFKIFKKWWSRKNQSVAISDLIEDKEAVAKSESEVAGVKDEMDLWFQRGYVLVQSLGSAKGFSRTYMIDLEQQMKDQGLNVEIVVINRSLVGLETGNLLGFNILAHVEDESAVRQFLVTWFDKAKS